MPRDALSPEAARDRALAFMASPAADSFEEAALAIFAAQIRHNPAYRLWCASLGTDPARVRRAAEIPAVPTAAFKDLEFCIAPPRAEFRTSGTTGAGTGKHLLPWLEPYRAGSLAHFKRCVLCEGWKMPTFLLAPPPDLRPASSLSRMLFFIIEEFGEPGSGWFVSRDGLECDRLAEALLDATRSRSPALLVGTSAAYLAFFRYCHRARLTLKLPGGSRLVDTGGQKGTGSAEPAPLAEFQAELYRQAEEFLGICPERCFNEYGMTEMCSQFYDVPPPPGAPGDAGPRVKIGPPWVLTRVLDPATLAPSAEGASGLLQHLDLANVGSVISVLTEDFGYLKDAGFVLEGRPREAEARGCGLTFSEIQGGR